jgi:DNA-binding CsgD family transcriptional regulator
MKNQAANCYRSCVVLIIIFFPLLTRGQYLAQDSIQRNEKKTEPHLLSESHLSHLRKKQERTSLQLGSGPAAVDQGDLNEDSDLNDRHRNNGAAVLFLVLVVIAVVVVTKKFVSNYKAALKVSREKEAELINELKKQEEISRNLRDELEFRAKQLTAFTLSMIQKKEMLEAVKAEIDEVRSSVEGNARIKLGKIINTINFSQKQDKDWENFKHYFEQVHQGFFDNLQAMYPELNAKHLRLCALLRLNLDTKQIATIMDIAPESAKVARHRIRKKLGLNNDDNLHVFFSAIAAGKITKATIDGSNRKNTLPSAGPSQ